jgi:hypothetical protein
MPAVPSKQVVEQLAVYGLPLENFFIIADAEDDQGVIAFWHPQVGLRGLIIDKDDLARATYDYLRDAGVRRFRSWDELGAAKQKEKWLGWDTCADWRRHQQALEELVKKRSK